MDEATRDRFRKVKALMSSPNAGEAEAARNRYAAMVEKYGDPSVQTFDPMAMMNRWYASGVVADLVDAMNAQRRSAKVAEAAFYETQRAAAARRQRTDPEHDEANAAFQHAIWLGKQCGRAVEWLMDEGYSVAGIAGGPWAVWDCDGDRFERLPPIFFAKTQQAIIDFAVTKGM